MSNEPAFPTHDASNHHDSRERILTGGMTLRDYFAGQALAGLCANPEYQIQLIGKGHEGSARHIADHAGLIADACLIERERGQ